MEINNTEPNPRECILECLQSQVCALTHGEKLLAEGYKSDAFVSRRVVVHNPWEPRTYDGGSQRTTVVSQRTTVDSGSSR